MKKTMMMLLAVSLVFALALPAMAETAVEFSGRYFVRGTMMDNAWMSDDSNAQDTYEDHRADWYDQELRMNVKFIANENVSVNMRMDIGDYNWGETNQYAAIGGTVDDFQLDRLWATIKTPYGILDVGRMAGGSWGLAFGDWATNGSDRIKFTTQVADLILIAIIEKRYEADATNLGNRTIDDDQDLDVYYLAGVYKQETFETGLLYGYARDRRNTGATFLTNPGTGDRNNAAEADQHVLNLYGIFNFGPFSIQGEVQHEMGNIDWNNALWADTDIDTWMWNLEAGYSAGPFSLAAGFGWIEGQEDNDVPRGLGNSTRTTLGGGEISAANMGDSGIGSDFAPLFVMTDVSGAVNNTTNWTTGLGVRLADRAVQSGMELWYLTASYQLMENLTLGLAAGYGEAEEDQPLLDDDWGTEIDFSVSWDAMDNVNYTVLLAWFDAGDLYAQELNGVNQGASGSDGDDVWAMRHTLTINF
jgi:hypothetical protein